MMEVETGAGVQDSAGDVPSLGGCRVCTPASWRCPQRGQGVTGLGKSRDVTRDDMFCDVTQAGVYCDVVESSNCPGAGLGPGPGKGDTCVTGVSPQSVGPSGHAGAAWALPFPQELLGTMGHCCKAACGQATSAPAAWRCPRLGDKPVTPGINMHK